MTEFSSYKDLQADPLLTNYGLEWKQGQFIADIICPPVQAPRAEGKYVVLGKEHFRRIKTKRADKANFAEYDGKFTKEAFETEPYGLKTYISDRERSNNDLPIVLDQQKVREMRMVLDLDKECRVFDLASAAGSVATDHSQELDALTAFDNFESSTSNPRKVIADAKMKIWRDSFQVPDTIIIPYDVAASLAAHPQIDALREKLGDRLITESGLPNPFFGLNVVIPSSGEITSKKGQTDVFAPVWSDTVIVCKTGRGQGQFGDPQWLASFRWGQFIVKRGRLLETDTDVIILDEQDKDEVLVSNLLAYKITNCLAAA